MNKTSPSVDNIAGDKSMTESSSPDNPPERKQGRAGTKSATSTVEEGKTKEKKPQASLDKFDKNQRGKNGTAKSNKTAKPQCRTLGPVPNLEAHVLPDWWRRIFNSLYLKTDGDVVDDQSITRHEIDMFWNFLQLSAEHKVLDLCCGQGRHSLELARRGCKYVDGLDRSSYLIQRGKGVAKKENLPVKFREGDARKLPFPVDNFDIVMIMGNSFGYFESKQDDLKVLKEVVRVLKPGGKILIDVTDGAYVGANFQPRSWEWIGKKQFVCRERSLSADLQRLISREVITDVERGVIADQFYAERLYTKESLSKLMQEAGLQDLNFHAEMIPDSQRNQDLGMMARRLILTATMKKEWSPRKKKTQEREREVVVLFGDPNKKDIIKPNTVFDADDFETINLLKGALSKFPEYHFTYLSNHDTWISDLKKQIGKVDLVFNLCDEGYFNDPYKELHVPAMLEVLGIPYTGGGPRCLSYCYDKGLVLTLAKEMGIPIPDGFTVKPEDSTFSIPLRFPVMVKPNFGDSSFGITARSVASNLEELWNAISGIRQTLGYDRPILVEEFLTGKDISIGIIGNPPTSYYTVLPIIAEDYSSLPEELPKICGYEAKWCPDSPYWNIKPMLADLPDDTEKIIVSSSLKLFERLECHDYVRFDWRLDGEGNPHLLEVNPNPGWCWDGHLAKMAKAAGFSYEEMIKMILQAAERRLKLFEEGGQEKGATNGNGSGGNGTGQHK